MQSHGYVYAALCITLPVIWGLIVYWIASLLEAELANSRPATTREDSGKPPTLPLDYHI